MSTRDELHTLRARRAQAFLQTVQARKDLEVARVACTDFLAEHPPKSFRLQEAYRNEDGTYATPHWDEVSPYDKQSLIDGGELDQHIIQEGEWVEVFLNEEDDPRPGFRRVIEVQW